MITRQGYIIMLTEIRRAKGMLLTLKDLENRWEVLSKANSFNKAFWKIDRKILALYKNLKCMKFSSYSIRAQDELKGYIEHLELQVEEYDALHENEDKTSWDADCERERRGLSE